MKSRHLLSALVSFSSLAAAQEMPPHHPQFNNVPILEAKEAKPIEGGLVIRGDALKAIQDAVRLRDGYGAAEVWEKMGVAVKDKGGTWKLAPSLFADGVLAESANIEKDPGAPLPYAQRAAAWHGAIVVVDGAVRQDNTFHLDTAQWRTIYDFPNAGLVDRDLEEVFKGPLTEETLRPVVLARRVNDYTPTPEGARTPEVVKLDDALALYAKASPQLNAQATVQRGVVMAKVALFAIGDKSPAAQKWFDSTSTSAKGILARTQGRGQMAFFLPAVEDAMGTANYDLAAQVAAAEAKSPLMAAETEIEIARTLWFAKLPEAARKWAAFAVKSAGDKPTPRLQWVSALLEEKGSDAQFAILKKCAFELSPGDADKVRAMGMLAEAAGAHGDKMLELRALEDQIMCGGEARLWSIYSEKARDAGQYGDAWNANRIALAWQPSGDGTPVAKHLLELPAGDPDAFSDADKDPNRKVLTRLDGAFILAKLGESAASRGEYDAVTDKNIDSSALKIHRHFLRAELKKTPDNADLKYGMLRLDAALG